MNENSLQSDKSISAIILSAGKSERFGEPKAFLKFDQTNSFIQHLIFEYYQAGIRNFIIVTNKDLQEEMYQQIQILPIDLNIKIVINPHPERGRFSSIKIALNALNKGNNVFIQNIDNPFTIASLVREMMDNIEDGIYVAPSFNNEKGHPVLLSDKIIQYIKNMNELEGNLRGVLSKFPAVEIKTDDPNIHANINTPETYMKYFNHAVLL